MSAAIELRGVTKVYRSGRGAVRAIEGVDFAVHPGELVLLMGPSGSGKSTLLTVMGCILRPTAGRVVVQGRDVTGLGEQELAGVRLRQIGFVFQDSSLFPSLNAAENVEMPLELLGIRGAKAHRRSAELLAAMGLAAKAREYPRDLSGGEKQRVGIARALAADARIVLADEPTAALDLATGRIVFGHLRQLADEGRAVVAVTHDHRLEDFATRIVRLEDGRLAEHQLAGGAS